MFLIYSLRKKCIKMKKFSNISGSKVPQEKKVEDVKINEEDLFKAKVLNLMDNLLNIQTYGPVDRYLRAGNIKITGKELFLESLLDLLKEKSLTQETKILESLKSSIKDWEVIDSKIDEANSKIEKIKTRNTISSNRKKIKSLYESYSQDEELLLQMVDESCKKISKAETAHLNSVAAEYMANEGKFPKSTFNKISEKFRNRAQQLGYYQQ